MRSWREPGEKEARAALWELMGMERPEGGMWLWSGKERFRGSRRRISWSLAAQIPADFGPETLKAQAVIARTYIYREMDGAEEIPEEALDMDALSGAQMEELWGGTYQEDYSRIREAVSATSGLYLAYEGEPAEVFFCRAASGATRSGGQEHPAGT